MGIVKLLGLHTRGIGLIQVLRKFALLFICLGSGVAALHIKSWWGDVSVERAAITALATVLLCVSVVGRVWAAVYVAGRKNYVLVATGPYAMVRNPLYLFSLVGTFGAALMLGSFVLAMVVTAAVYGVFRVVIDKEEALMGRIHGAVYAAYVADVPRLLLRLRPSGWAKAMAGREVTKLEIDQRILLQSLADSSMFFAAVPMAALIELLRIYRPFVALIELP